jgi:hypothetical protein
LVFRVWFVGGGLGARPPPAPPPPPPPPPRQVRLVNDERVGAARPDTLGMGRMDPRDIRAQLPGEDETPPGQKRETGPDPESGLAGADAELLRLFQQRFVRRFDGRPPTQPRHEPDPMEAEQGQRSRRRSGA